ncbi:hypothetical protein PR048_002915 [Dryococelus australis]|uniref:Uncharacterized protein n=1 Tax=Dryococelus australis TaxID=614101 RepID=A0ABQ9ILM3_9NEOP|nr:hypothetical protein PR048_002915 [Dryococelus australis]
MLENILQLVRHAGQLYTMAPCVRLVFFSTLWFPHFGSFSLVYRIRVIFNMSEAVRMTCHANGKSECGARSICSCYRWWWFAVVGERPGRRPRWQPPRLLVSEIGGGGGVAVVVVVVWRGGVGRGSMDIATILIAALVEGDRAGRTGCQHSRWWGFVIARYSVEWDSIIGSHTTRWDIVVGSQTAWWGSVLGRQLTVSWGSILGRQTPFCQSVPTGSSQISWPPVGQCDFQDGGQEGNNMCGSMPRESLRWNDRAGSSGPRYSPGVVAKRLHIIAHFQPQCANIPEGAGTDLGDGGVGGVHVASVDDDDSVAAGSLGACLQHHLPDVLRGGEEQAAVGPGQTPARPHTWFLSARVLEPLWQKGARMCGRARFGLRIWPTVVLILVALRSKVVFPVRTIVSKFWEVVDWGSNGVLRPRSIGISASNLRKKRPTVATREYIKGASHVYSIYSTVAAGITPPVCLLGMHWLHYRGEGWWEVGDPNSPISPRSNIDSPLGSFPPSSPFSCKVLDKANCECRTDTNKDDTIKNLQKKVEKLKKRYNRMKSAEPMRVIEVSMKQRRNERACEEGDPRENPLTNGIVWHDSHMRQSGVTRPGIEPELHWWEASRLTAQPP